MRMTICMGTVSVGYSKEPEAGREGYAGAPSPSNGK